MNVKAQECLSYKKRQFIGIVFGILIICSLLCAFSSIASASGNGSGRRFGGTIVISTDQYKALCEEMSEEISVMEELHELFYVKGPEDPSMLYSLMEAGNSPVKTGRSILSVFGISLICIYSGIQLYKMLQREEESIETIMRILTTAFIGILAVIYIHDILTEIEKLGNMFITKLYNESYRAADTKITYHMFKGEDIEISIAFKDIFTKQFYKNIVLLIRNFLLSEAAYGIGRICLFFTFYSIITSAYALIFELVIRKMFAPLAMADLTLNGPRSASIKYIKGYLGMYIRIAVMLVVVALGVFVQHWAENPANGSVALEMNDRLGALGVAICSRMAMKATMNTSGELVRGLLTGNGE